MILNLGLALVSVVLVVCVSFYNLTMTSLGYKLSLILFLGVHCDGGYTMNPPIKRWARLTCVGDNILKFQQMAVFLHE